MSEVKKFDKEYVTNTLNKYYSEGTDALEDRKTVYDNAERIWEREYENEDVPDDSIYYPTTRNDTAEIQRSIAQVYSSTEDIVDIKPKRNGAPEEVGLIAEAHKKLYNDKVDDSQYESRSRFPDDVTLQLVKLGGAIGKWSWIRKTEPVYEEQQVIQEDMSVEDVIVQVGERIVENRPKREYINHERLIWDTNATSWTDVRWVMEIELEKTAGQLFEMVETHGFDEKTVKEFLKDNPGGESNVDEDTAVSKADANKTYELREFWGWISLDRDGYRQEFVRFITDKTFEYFFLGPIKHPDKNIYRYLDGQPMIPYQVGYASPKEGEIVGDSLILLSKELQQEENCLRNAIRRSAEQDLHSIFAIRRGSGIDANKLANREQGAIIWTNDDPSKSAREFPHSDTTVSGIRDLELNKMDRQKTYGNTSFNMGIEDPSQPDSATGLALMQNSSNRIKNYFIMRFNDSFYEPFAYKGLCMIVQYTTTSEYKELGVNMPRSRLMTGQTRIKVDTDTAATSKIAQKKNMTENYFLVQQAISYASQAGLVLPPKLLEAPIKILKKIVELNGDPASGKYIPDAEEIIKMSRQFEQKKQQMQQQQTQEIKQKEQQMLANAEKAGREQARQELIGE